MTAHQDATPDEALARFWDAEDDDRQPWCPPGAWVPKVGDRVRIRLGECEYHWETDLRPDVERLNGMVGSVAYIETGRRDGHTVAVRVDTPFDSVRPSRRTIGTLCALGELIPLDQPATDDEGAARDGAREGEP